MKIFLIALSVWMFTGCAHFKVSGTNCEDIGLNDPNSQNIPAECMDYNAQDADKATYPNGQRPAEINNDFQIGK